MNAPWFDGRQFDPATGGTSFPVGRHLAIIKAGVRTPVKDKPNEAYLGLTLEIIDGPNKGVSGVYRLNMWNASPQACEIAAKQLTALCCVTGRFDIYTPNASELFGIPLFIIVQQQPPPNDKYTEIVSFLDANGQPPVKGQGPSGSPQQPMQQPPQQPPMQQQPAQPQWQSPQQQPPAQPAAPQWQQQAQQAQPPVNPGWAVPPQQPPVQQPPAGWQQPPQQPQQPPMQQQQPQPVQPPQPQWQQQPATGAKPAWAQ